MQQSKMCELLLPCSGWPAPNLTEVFRRFLNDLRFIPLLLSTILLSWQVIDVFLYLIRPSSGNGDTGRFTSIWTRFRDLITAVIEISVVQDGSYGHFGYAVTRLMGTLVLVYLSASTIRNGECIELGSRIQWLPFRVCPEDSITVSLVSLVLCSPFSILRGICIDIRGIAGGSLF